MARLTTLRRLVDFVLRAPERFKHVARRRAAVATLRSHDRPNTILFVCHGNLCRSPYAAAALRRRLASAAPGIAIQSAGFFGSDRSPPADAIAAAGARGSDVSTHRSRLVSRALLDAADLIVVMDSQQSRAVTARHDGQRRRVIVLGDLDPWPIETREIVDPLGGPRTAFNSCYARIDRCVDELVKGLLRFGQI